MAAPVTKKATLKMSSRRAPPTVHRPLPPNRSIPGLATAKPITSTGSSQPNRSYTQPQSSQRSYAPTTTPSRSFATAKPISSSQPSSQPRSFTQPQPQRVARTASPAVFNTGSASPATLQDWAEKQQYLDIYQINAFYMGTAQRSQYFMSLWKTATCFGLQFVAIYLLMLDQWGVYQDSGGGACSGIKGSVSLVGFFFATYITMFCTEQIRTLNRYGMYGWGEQQPDFVNSLWVGIGLWVNVFSLTMSWFVSCIIIFTSEDILNMVLNSVAVTFMLTLDDEILSDADYNRILRWDGRNQTMCPGINALYRKIGGILLKIHPWWQRRVVYKGKVYECCDLILCPFMILLPLIVLFCYPFPDQICLYEDVDDLCYQA